MPSVREWYDKKALKSEGTAEVFFANLGSYWFRNVQPKGYATIDDWVREVKAQQRNDDVKVRRQWAVDVEALLQQLRISADKAQANT